MNKLIIVGTTSKPPEKINYGDQGKSFATFEVEVPNRFGKYPTRVTVKCFGKLAEGLPPLANGRMVCVSGRAEADSYISKKTGKAVGLLCCAADEVQTLDGDGGGQDDQPAPRQPATNQARPAGRPAPVTPPPEDDLDSSVPF